MSLLLASLAVCAAYAVSSRDGLEVADARSAVRRDLSDPSLGVSTPMSRAAPMVELGPAPEQPTGFVNLPTRRRERRAPSFNVANRAEMYAAFQRSQAQIAAASSPNWSGSVAGCNAGDVSSLWRAATIARLNLYREMCGLDNVTTDATMNTDTQKGALIISSTGVLTHTPASNSLCYTNAGDLSSQQSNIAIGSYGPAAVDAFIDDAGGNNAVVGHRRWKLYPQLAVVGSGDTGTTGWNGVGSYGAYGNNIMVLGRSRLNGVESFGSGRTSPNFVAWPPGGFCPFSLLPSSARWSFSKQGVNFATATVTINGVAATVTSRPSDFYMPTVVFTGPTPSSWNGVETSYNVRVTAGGQVYAYTVIVFDGLTPNTPTCTNAAVTVQPTTPNGCFAGAYVLEGTAQQPTLSNGRVYYKSTTSRCGLGIIYVYWTGYSWYFNPTLQSQSGYAANSADVARPQDVPPNTWAIPGNNGFVIEPTFVMTFSGCGAPNTAAPTTRAPATVAPTTAAPNTAAPTTQAPNTAAPTTRAPATAAPNTARPTTARPTTKRPTTKRPTTRRPTARPTRAPITARPTRAPTAPTAAPTIVR